tara:strand:- start:209 stop:592 length:384 start_codon:yes stop_codon:yes gene_type:complete
MEIVEQIKQIVEDLESKKDLIDKLAKRNTELEKVIQHKYIEECKDTILGEHTIVSNKLLKELKDKVDEAYWSIDSISDEFSEVESLADEIRDKVCYHGASDARDELKELGDTISDLMIEEVEESEDA